VGYAEKRIRRHVIKLAVSSTIRGSHRGESHGRLHLIDFESQLSRILLDWDTPRIEWHGLGGDRGLRGIAFDDARIYVAASDQLIAYTPKFEHIDSWHNPYLKHCQEIAVWDRTLYLASSAYDSILGFDLDEHRFSWAINVQSSGYRFGGEAFDPMSDDGPLMLEKYQLNSLHCDQHGIYITGDKTGGMLHFNGKNINMAVQLPAKTNNVRPFRDGVLFNDNQQNVLRYTGRGEGQEDRAMQMPACDLAELQDNDAVEENIAQPGFARGLCVLTDGIVAGGSSPSTVTLYDLPANETMGSIRLTTDVRSTVHSIVQWPFD
jgi:hypothetical protein